MSVHGNQNPEVRKPKTLSLTCFFIKTGAGTTISRLGMPDLGVATLNDMRDNAGMIASLDFKIPLIADADTGYGGVYGSVSGVLLFS
jgi:2-methylisocitrate lyase-like PEP mutase family enzyme